jgi:hypothetical protein
MICGRIGRAVPAEPGDCGTGSWMPVPKAHFAESMLLRRAKKLPQGEEEAGVCFAHCGSAGVSVGS